MLSKEEYEKTVIRMMDSVREFKNHMGEFNCKDVTCGDCPIFESCSVKFSRIESAYSIVENVEKWGKEHPIVTNADKYREVFGTSPIMINADGSFVCPERVGFDCNCKAIDSCTTCKINFWTSEYKAPKGE